MSFQKTIIFKGIAIGPWGVKEILAISWNPNSEQYGFADKDFGCVDRNISTPMPLREGSVLQHDSNPSE
jgi:hypothetical protein